MMSSGSKRGRGETEELVIKKEDERVVPMASPLTPSNWSTIWESGDGKGIFDLL